jgi:serine/threonine protein kinase
MYDQAIDMWSFGCILMELYVGSPLFPGDTQYEHMAYMISTLGMPPNSMIKKS